MYYFKIAGDDIPQIKALLEDIAFLVEQKEFKSYFKEPITKTQILTFEDHFNYPYTYCKENCNNPLSKEIREDSIFIKEIKRKIEPVKYKKIKKETCYFIEFADSNYKSMHSKIKPISQLINKTKIIQLKDLKHDVMLFQNLLQNSGRYEHYALKMPMTNFETIESSEYKLFYEQQKRLYLTILDNIINKNEDEITKNDLKIIKKINSKKILESNYLEKAIDITKYKLEQNKNNQNIITKILQYFS